LFWDIVQILCSSITFNQCSLYYVLISNRISALISHINLWYSFPLIFKEILKLSCQVFKKDIIIFFLSGTTAHIYWDCLIVITNRFLWSIYKDHTKPVLGLMSTILYFHLQIGLFFIICLLSLCRTIINCVY
jgi:hypothetical protein